MHKRASYILITGLCLGVAFLAVSQEAGHDKAALHAVAKARVEQQSGVNAEKARILANVNRMAPGERPAALLRELKNSTVLQEARKTEAGEAGAAIMGRADQGARDHEILAKVNQLPAAERQHALREAMIELKGKKDAAGGQGSAPYAKGQAAGN